MHICTIIVVSEISGVAVKGLMLKYLFLYTPVLKA